MQVAHEWYALVRDELFKLLKKYNFKRTYMVISSVKLTEQELKEWMLTNDGFKERMERVVDERDLRDVQKFQDLLSSIHT